MIQALSPIEPIDYLVIGHITQDITPFGFKAGGTASYAALTAHAFGLRVGIFTSFAEGAILPNLEGIQVVNQISDKSSVFENIYTKQGRHQIIHSVAETLHPRNLPESWHNTPLVHFGPIAREIDNDFLRIFQDSFVGITPQGWYRDWDSQGNIHFTNWPESNFFLEKANAAVLSIEDVKENEDIIASLVYAVRVLGVTEGAKGARIYWNGDVRNFRPPETTEIDSTGAGDIFATSFFIRLRQTQDPWEAARFATLIASRSVTRNTLDGVPTPEEVQKDLIDIVNRS
ncbi:MAG: PfkB family carbohydrate kinase [Anaerolineaceae bacterium]